MAVSLNVTSCEMSLMVTAVITLCGLPDAEYNSVKDITKYEGMADTYVTCKPGEFAIFFPQDGHAPCISDAAEIKKAIFKVLA